MKPLHLLAALFLISLQPSTTHATDESVAQLKASLNEPLFIGNELNVWSKIAKHYEEGTGGVSVDEKKALNIYHQIAQHGNRYGSYKLARAYFEGKLVKQDYKETLRWVLAASYHNSVFERVRHDGYDYKSGKYMVKKRINGDLFGFDRQEEQVIYNNLNRKDEAEIYYYWARMKDSSIQYKNDPKEDKVGGRPVKKLTSRDIDRVTRHDGNYYGFEWYEVAAQLGHLEAQKHLAKFYEKDMLSFQNFSQASMAGYWNGVLADRGLGDEYEWNFTKLTLSAHKTNEDQLRKAIILGTAFGSTDGHKYQEEAGLALASFYLSDKTTLKSTPKAIGWLEELADKGFASAMTNLGQLYLRGVHIPRNKTKAKMWYTRASDAGESPDLFYYLAVEMLESDDGAERKTYDIPQDIQEGLYWLHKSVELGSASGFKKLGVYYVHGTHIRKNIEKGIAYLQKAKQLGYSYRIYYAEEGYQYDPFYSKRLKEKAKPADLSLALRLYSLGAYYEANSNAMVRIIDLHLEKKNTVISVGEVYQWAKLLEQFSKADSKQKYMDIAEKIGNTLSSNKRIELENNLQKWLAHIRSKPALPPKPKSGIGFQ
ncbi:hypothetical protein QGN29_09525 [Temperatibacter marinus]|uniref:Sel1 repeat family protein n=1 Tax=Temperatibacter marinus TaxID=1456591 RepID=A0AA52H861_9PROT|nr:hypothetical protein [Temperatibacter marinus]WND01791.1 hypothetical protein QGN29_09525 [Temperatibacter marinus]